MHDAEDAVLPRALPAPPSLASHFLRSNLGHPTEDEHYLNTGEDNSGLGKSVG